MQDEDLVRRVGRRRVAVGLAVVGVMVGGMGGAAAAIPRTDATVKAVQGTQWSPKDVAITTGETVTWDFNSGDGQPHNVGGVTGEPLTVTVPVITACTLQANV